MHKACRRSINKASPSASYTGFTLGVWGSDFERFETQQDSRGLTRFWQWLFHVQGQNDNKMRLFPFGSAAVGGYPVSKTFLIAKRMLRKQAKTVLLSLLEVKCTHCHYRVTSLIRNSPPP